MGTPSACVFVSDWKVELEVKKIDLSSSETDLPIPVGRRSRSDMFTCVVDNNISNEKRVGMPANLLPHNPHKTCNIRHN